METTNSIFNTSLYDYVTPQSVMYWIRAVVANRMAKDAVSWHQIFQRYNSGTYNNQWMVFDHNRFTPGQPLPADTYWVGEQIPGYYHAEDQTMSLQWGEWPSYNVPYYTEIYNRSGYPAAVAARGVNLSYQVKEGKTGPEVYVFGVAHSYP